MDAAKLVKKKGAFLGPIAAAITLAPKHRLSIPYFWSKYLMELDSSEEALFLIVRWVCDPEPTRL